MLSADRGLLLLQPGGVVHRRRGAMQCGRVLMFVTGAAAVGHQGGLLMGGGRSPVRGPGVHVPRGSVAVGHDGALQ